MRLGKFAGVNIKLNWFFLVFSLIYCSLGMGYEILIIFSSVFLHELAHTLMAGILGVKVSEIELLPFGGQSKIEDFTGLDPDREIYIALIGPIFSLSIAGFFYFLYSGPRSDLLQLFIYINFFLGIFNLLPALPLDGGKVMRAFLSKIQGYKKATSTAALFGKIIALCIFLYGSYLSLTTFNGANYIVIGFLLYWSARQEGKFLAYSFMRFLVNKKSELSKSGFLPVKHLVSHEDTLVKKILESSRPSYYLIISILDEKHSIVAVFTEAELIEGLFEKGPLLRLKDL